MVHLILRPVYTIGWKSRKSHFHPTTVSSYRIYIFWFSRNFENAIRLDWFPGHGTTDLCSLILIFLLIKIVILKYFILNIQKFNGITSESGSSDDNSSLFNKKSVLQTKYRPLFLKIQTKIWKCLSKSIEQRIGVLYQIGLFNVFISTSS